MKFINASGNLAFQTDEEHIKDDLMIAIEKGVDLRGVDFSGLNLSGLIILNTNFQDCNFDKADLSKVFFRNCKFRGTKFESANLENSHMGKCDVTRVKFKNCNLRGFTFNKIRGYGRSFTMMKKIVNQIGKQHFFQSDLEAFEYLTGKSVCYPQIKVDITEKVLSFTKHLSDKGYSEYYEMYVKELENRKRDDYVTQEKVE